MKQGWKYEKVGELFTTYSGGTPHKSHNEYYDGGNIPWIRSGEVCQKYITECEKFITNEGLKNSSAKFFPINTVLVAMYGATAAQVGILKFEATSNQAVCGILPSEKFVPEFIYYWFKLIENELASQAQGGAQPNISQQKIKNVLLPILSLNEQQRIVENIDKAFEDIDTLKDNAQKQLDDARKLFQAALTEAMQPKEGWKHLPFKSISTFVRGPFGGSLKKECFVNNGYAVYEQQNAIYNRFSFRYFIDENKYKSMIRFSVNPGDLIMSCSGTIGKVAIVPEDAPKGIINQALLKLTPSKDVDKNFLKYLMESDLFKELIKSYSDGAAIKNIASVNVLKEIQLTIPSISEQLIIVERLDALNYNVRKMEEINRKVIAECDALKQSILRQIFE